MSSGKFTVLQLVVCLLGLPYLALMAVFLICYSPLYLLISLFRLLKAESKRTINNNSSRTILSKLEVQHA